MGRSKGRWRKDCDTYIQRRRSTSSGGCPLPLLTAASPFACADVPHTAVCAQIGYVKGIDLSPGEIAEAQTRYQQVLRKYGAHPCAYLSHVQIKLIASTPSTMRVGMFDCIAGPLLRCRT